MATAKGRHVGRPSVVSEPQLAYATALREGGATIAEIMTKTGLTRSTLYRHLPPRPPNPVTTPAPESGHHPGPRIRSPPRSRTPIPRRQRRRRRHPLTRRCQTILWRARPAGTGPPNTTRSSRTETTSPPSGCT
ncbi:helix-turn-helix domain-containing protein [Rhodococcus jostii]|uniref:helix-turn-helix domain-containing protein n=1 Tax=Rhodococcus jostii TaxID=132919 RepID=UPI00362D7572